MATVSQAENVPLRVALNPATLARDLWTRRGLIGQMAFREFNQRYRASTFGMFWAIAQPLMMLVIFTVLFSQVFAAKVPGRETGNPMDFALMIYSGLLVYNLFSECVGRSASSIVGQPNYVKKVVFPLQTFPVSIAISALIMATINIVILCGANLIFRHTLPATLIVMPIVLLPVMMFAMGMGFFLSSLGVYIRDVEHVVAITLQVLFYLSPVFYSLDQLPPALAPYIELNPLSHMIENGRDVLLWGEWPSVGIYLGTLALGALSLQLGYAWFVKTRGGFADVL